MLRSVSSSPRPGGTQLLGLLVLAGGRTLTVEDLGASQWQGLRKDFL